jgi:hypothetical protein
VVPAVLGAGQTLFSDNFASDPLGTAVPAGWSLDGATSRVDGLLSGVPVLGSLGLGTTVTSLLPREVLDGTTPVLSRVGNTWTRLTAGSAWLDYSVSADMKTLPSGSGFVGVSGRYRDANNYLACGIRADQGLQLWDVVNGQATLLSSKPMDIASGVFHTVQMQMQGAQVSCSLDGVTLAHGTDTSVSAGKIGLIALGNLASEFDSVKATTLG